MPAPQPGNHQHKQEHQYAQVTFQSMPLRKPFSPRICPGFNVKKKKGALSVTGVTL